MPLLLRRSGSSQAILQSIREQPAEPPMYVVIHNIEGSGEMSDDKPLAASCPAFATLQSQCKCRCMLLGLRMQDTPAPTSVQSTACYCLCFP